VYSTYTAVPEDAAVSPLTEVSGYATVSPVTEVPGDDAVSRHLRFLEMLPCLLYLRFLEMLQDSDFDPSSTCSEQRPHTNEAVQMEPRMTFRKDILPTSGFGYQNTETSIVWVSA
jgi:hypothetical protein